VDAERHLIDPERDEKFRAAAGETAAALRRASIAMKKRTASRLRAALLIDTDISVLTLPNFHHFG
jgi:hypothetical protein